jgi:hypothetical protein
VAAFRNGWTRSGAWTRALYKPFEDGASAPKCYRMVQRMGGMRTLTREEDPACSP